MPAKSSVLTGPAPAARKALARAGMTVDEIDLFEVNEAFAVVPMKFMKELHVSDEIVNVNGGAIALGHPLGASGARILLTLHRPALLGLDFPTCGLPMAATLTRVATRRLDDDNLASAFKAIRDEVAAFFRLDDGSQLWRWRYEQAKGAPAIQFRFEVAEGAGHYASGEQATGDVDALTERVRQLEAELAQARK